LSGAIIPRAFDISAEALMSNAGGGEVKSELRKLGQKLFERY